MLLYVHGAQLAGDVGRINQLASPRGVLEVPTISNSAMERLLGPGDGIIDFTSWFNDAAVQAHPILSALPTTDVVALLLKSSTFGDPAWGLVAKQANYDPTRGPDGSLSFDVQCLGQGSPLEDLLALTSGEDTVTGATEGTSLDQTAIGQTSRGGIGYLGIREVTGGTGVISIEDSPNNSAWSTLITFAANGGSVPIGERKTVTGTVDQWIHYDIAAGLTAIDFAMAWRRGQTVDDADLS
tara:strand:- start:1510 stop:2229 length:720 start_codon:yes stop_codon:yes gene_type:complete